VVKSEWNRGGRGASGWLAALALCLAVPAHAAARWGGAVALSTDYVFRGVSQTGAGAAVQADVHVAADQWFVGLWASVADPPPGYVANYEVNTYLGRTWLMSDRWTATALFVHYAYPDELRGVALDYDEVLASVAFEDRASLTVGASPDLKRHASNGNNYRYNTRSYEISLRQPVWAWISIEGGAGYYDRALPDGGAYWAWNAGITGRRGPFEIGVTRFGVDSAGRRFFGADSADGRWVVSVRWRW
jgi:uncharacterized protein (TIGR02001 family)